jgi:CubicO group peptidase (beta-lactamase class C family)
MLKMQFSLIILILICNCIKSQNKSAVNAQNGLKNGITETQKELIFEKTKVFPNGTQVSIAIIENGIPKFYGIKRENDSILSFDNHQNVFEIGSITKVFTSTLLADFVIEKKLNLDEEINEFLNFPLKNNVKISFKQLANHTSGLPNLPSNIVKSWENFKNPEKDYNEEKLKEYLMDSLELTQNPGMKYEYSNLGVGLLGYVLCQVDNTNYENLLKTKIFSKYRMSSSTTVRGMIKNGLIKGINSQGKEVPNSDFSVLMGASGVLSTTEDLSKFAVAQFDNSNKELTLTRLRTFDINDNLSIGLGWFIYNSFYWHGGNTEGYTSSMYMDTKKEIGIIILSNVSLYNINTRNIDELSYSLLSLLEEH